VVVLVGVCDLEGDLDPGIEALASGALEVLLRLEYDFVQPARLERRAVRACCVLWEKLHAAAVRVGLAFREWVKERGCMVNRVVLLYAYLDPCGGLAQG